MWRFVKLIDERPGQKPINYSWVVIIDSMVKIMTYNMDVHVPRLSEGYWNYTHSKEFYYNTGIDSGDNHCSHPLAFPIAQLHRCGENTTKVLDELNTGLLRTQWTERTNTK